MKEHLQQIQSDDIHNHYLGKTIHNELISIMESKVQEAITTWTKQAKHYIIILDCTPDVSHQEQFSLTIQFVKLDESPDVPVSKEELFFLSRKQVAKNYQMLYYKNRKLCSYCQKTFMVRNMTMGLI